MPPAVGIVEDGLPQALSTVMEGAAAEPQPACNKNNTKHIRIAQK
jgi:hypothetical protein